MSRAILLVAALLTVQAAASAAPVGTMWVQPVGGGNTITVGVGESAVIQLWLDVNAVPAGARLVLAQGILNWSQDNVPASHFDVIGFKDQGPWGTFERVEPRGYIPNPPPSGQKLVDYQYLGFDEVQPYTHSSGLDPGTYLLDEIVIQGASQGTGDQVLFPAGVTAPNGYVAYPGYSSGQVWYAVSLAVGTGASNPKGVDDPLFVNVTPEPAAMSLLVLGGLAALRRRRS